MFGNPFNTAEKITKEHWNGKQEPQWSEYTEALRSAWPLSFGVMIFTRYLRVEGKMLLYQAEFLNAHKQLLPLL